MRTPRPSRRSANERDMGAGHGQRGRQPSGSVADGPQLRSHHVGLGGHGGQDLGADRRRAAGVADAGALGARHGEWADVQGRKVEGREAERADAVLEIWCWAIF